MAVQQNKKSRSKVGMHRSHDRLTAKALTVDQQGEVHLRHHVSPRSGMYRGKQIVKVKDKSNESADE